MPGSRGECVSGRRSELISSYLDTMVRSLLLIAALACASAAQVEFSIKGLKAGLRRHPQRCVESGRFRTAVGCFQPTKQTPRTD